MKPISPALLLIAALAANLSLPATAPGCTQGAEVRIWTAPRRPQPGEAVEILAVDTDGALDDLSVTDPSSGSVPLHATRSGGPPWGLAATLPLMILSALFAGSLKRRVAGPPPTL